MKENNPIKQKYWNKLKTITLILIVLWFIPTFVISFFANELTFDFFGWPFSFWDGIPGVAVNLLAHCLDLCIIRE